MCACVCACLRARVCVCVLRQLALRLRFSRKQLTIRPKIKINIDYNLTPDFGNYTLVLLFLRRKYDGFKHFICLFSFFWFHNLELCQLLSECWYKNSFCQKRNRKNINTNHDALWHYDFNIDAKKPCFQKKTCRTLPNYLNFVDFKHFILKLSE